MSNAEFAENAKKVDIFGNQNWGSIPPHDLASEAMILGSLLYDGKHFERIPSEFTAEAFFSRAHATTFESIRRLLTEQDMVGSDGILHAVAHDLRERGRFAEVGGFGPLTEMMNDTPVLTNAMFDRYVDTVLRLSTLRRLIRALQKSVAEAYQRPDDLNDFLLRTEKAIVDLSIASKSNEPRKLRDVLREEMKTWIDENSGGKSKGVATGFHRVDKTVGNLQAGDLAIVAARPGMGKTSFVTSIVKNIAESPNEGGLIFSLEMPAEQLAGRMLCTEAGFSMKKIRMGRMSSEDITKGTHAASVLGDLDIYLDDASTGRPSVGDIATKSRRLAAKLRRERKRLSVIVVDYLQIVKLDKALAHQRHDLAVGEVSIELKSLAKQLGCPIVACAQLNREVEKRQDKRPTKADLRDSGQIEQDADIIFMLYRESYYAAKDSDSKPESGGVVDVIIEKNRNGPPGAVQLYFDGPTTRFSNLESSEAWD